MADVHAKLVNPNLKVFRHGVEVLLLIDDFDEATQTSSIIEIMMPEGQADEWASALRTPAS